MEASRGVDPVTQLTVVVHVPHLFRKHLNQRKWRLQNCLAVKKKTRAPRTLFLSLRHGQVYSIISNIVDKVCRCSSKRKHINKKGRAIIPLPLHEKLPTGDTELLKLAKSMTEQQ